MIFLAQFLSVLFHPVIFFLSMPFFVVYRQTDNSVSAFKWMLLSSIFVLGGVVWVFWERFAGRLSDYDLSKRRERRLFYLVIDFLAVIYLLLAIFYKGIFSPLSIITFGIILGIVLFELVNLRLKASVHIGVASAWIVSMGILFGQDIFLATIWILPAVSWARLVLKRHTLYEVITGGILGAGITLLTYIIGKNFYG